MKALLTLWYCHTSLQKDQHLLSCHSFIFLWPLVSACTWKQTLFDQQQFFLSLCKNREEVGKPRIYSDIWLFFFKHGFSSQFWKIEPWRDIFVESPLKEIIQLCNVVTALMFCFVFFYFSCNSKFSKQIRGQSATNSFQKSPAHGAIEYTSILVLSSTLSQSRDWNLGHWLSLYVTFGNYIFIAPGKRRKELEK